MNPNSGENFEKLLTKLGAAANQFRAIVTSGTFHGVISAADASSLASQAGVSVQELSLMLVDFASLYAVVPVSNYHVGAVAIGLSGALYYGANLEVSGAALSFTLHAEQSSVANAWINGEQGLQSLAVSAAPCGYCRQFLYELVDASTLTVYLIGQQQQLLTYYLPDAFGPHDLGVTGGLMQPQANGLTLQGSLDAATQAALNAANASYSPYTSTFAGVALATADGTVCVGYYGENAAYNPSLSPLEAALSQLVFYNQSFDSIVEAVLVEAAAGQASQVSATEAVLQCVSGVNLQICFAEQG